MERKIKFNHSDKLNNNLLALICGESECGKTYLLFKMLTTPGILDYNNLIILTSTPEQPYYQLLKYGFENNLSKDAIQELYKIYEDSDEEMDIEGMCIDAATESVLLDDENLNIKVTLTDDSSIIKNPSKLKHLKNIVVFDDIVTMKDQRIPQMMFTKGRHNKCACIYLSQSYFGIDGQYIRKNANVIILFQLAKKNISNLLQDTYVGDEDKFKQFAHDTWTENEYGYVVVNTKKKTYFDNLFE